MLSRTSDTRQTSDPASNVDVLVSGEKYQSLVAVLREIPVIIMRQLVSLAKESVQDTLRKTQVTEEENEEKTRLF